MEAGVTWLALVLVYPLWVLVHEGTHALVARHYGCTIEKFRPWPHRLDSGRFVWGSIRRRCGELNGTETGWISFSPRVPALIACAVLVVSAWAHAPIWVLVLLAGGLVDQAVNSIGYTAGTDLQRWCAAWDHPPWTWQIFGGSVVGTVLLGCGLAYV